MRILGLDVGEKRIGMALSDELMITAQGIPTFERRSFDYDMAEISRIITENNVSEVVVGLPLNMNGTYSAKTKEVASFTEKLSSSLSIPVKTWDERLTTMQAERSLLEGDMSRMKRKRLKDRLAAQLILQCYLDSKKRNNNV